MGNDRREAKGLKGKGGDRERTVALLSSIGAGHELITPADAASYSAQTREPDDVATLAADYGVPEEVAAKTGALLRVGETLALLFDEDGRYLGLVSDEGGLSGFCGRGEALAPLYAVPDGGR